MRRLAMVLAAVLLFAVGCGSDDEAGDTGSSPSPAAGSAATTAGGAASTAGDEPAATTAGSRPQTETAPETASPKERVEEAIRGALLSGDPGLACGRVVTPGYLRAAYGGRDGCVRSQGAEAVAEDVEIDAVRVTGGRASAVAVPAGGPSDGQELEVALVREGGAWKVDRIRSDVPVGP